MKCSVGHANFWFAILGVVDIASVEPSPTIINIGGVDKIIETPVNVTQYSSTAPQSTFSQNDHAYNKI